MRGVIRTQLPDWQKIGLPYHVYAKEKKEEGKKEEKEGGKGKNAEFSRRWIVFCATEH
jgi:hypothetical protein